MAVEPLTPIYENKELFVKRGDRVVVHQPFRPAIGDEPRRDWKSEADALVYWETVKDDYFWSGLTSEESAELAAEIAAANTESVSQ